MGTKVYIKVREMTDTKLFAFTYTTLFEYNTTKMDIDLIVGVCCQ